MYPWREPDFHRDLRRLLLHARRNRNVFPNAATDPFQLRIVPGGSYAILGDYLALRRSLQRRIAGSSRRDYGVSVEEAGTLVTTACDEAVTGTVKSAIENLMDALEAPIEDTMVAIPLPIFIPGGELKIGAVTYSTRIPRSVARPRTLKLAQPGSFEPPIAFVKVRARDAQTAQVLAAENFAESTAILDLIQNRPKRGIAPTVVFRRKDGSGRITYSRPTPIVNDGLVDATDRLVPPYRQLSRAAARSEEKRTDWERRVLAATRLFSTAWRSEWPADRLASLMMALECLFVEGIAERDKGSLIAKRLTERFKLNELTQTEQRDWLRKLYRQRNAAVHEGRGFVNDLEGDRLLELTQYVIRHLAVHLIPGHRRKGRSCTSFQAAMRCSRP